MGIKTGLKSKTLWIPIFMVVLFIGSTLVFAYVLGNELNDIKQRYCEVSPYSTFCQMYPNTKE